MKNTWSVMFLNYKDLGTHLQMRRVTRFWREWKLALSEQILRQGIPVVRRSPRSARWLRSSLWSKPKFFWYMTSSQKPFTFMFQDRRTENFQSRWPAMYKELFRAGLQLPLYPFLVDILDFYQLPQHELYTYFHQLLEVNIPVTNIELSIIVCTHNRHRSTCYGIIPFVMLVQS